MNFATMLANGPKFSSDKPKRTNNRSSEVRSARITAEYMAVIGDETLSTTQIAYKKGVCRATASSSMHKLAKRGIVENAGYVKEKSSNPVALWRLKRE